MLHTNNMYSKYIENIYYKQQTYFYHNQGYQLYIYIGGGVQGFVLIDPYIYIYIHNCVFFVDGIIYNS